MKKFLTCVFISILSLPCIAGVGSSDNRYYVTDKMWSTHPYNKFVRLTTTTFVPILQYEKETDEDGDIILVEKEYKYPIPGTCTGQYISPNLILSAGHCTSEDENVEYSANNYKNETIPLKLIETPYKGDAAKLDTLGDWAVWLITDPAYYSKPGQYPNLTGPQYFDIQIPNSTTDVINAGFGYVRILHNNEIGTIRDILNNFKQEEQLSSSQINESKLNNLLETNGIESLQEDWPYKLKASECKIVFEDCTKISEKLLKNYDKNNEKNMLKYSEKFKNICDNRIQSEHASTYPNVLATTCDSWGGNSGGADISKDGTRIYGICSFGSILSSGLNDFTTVNYIASSKQFAPRIQELIKIYDSKNSVEQNIAKIPKTIFKTKINHSKEEKTSKPNSSTESHLARLTHKVNRIENQAIDLLWQIDNNSSDDQILMFLDKYITYKIEKTKLEQLQQKYEEAKGNEQSKANRLLTAASIAATGIGGMELAQGLAEQKADKAAAQNMAAYIATMRCKYGKDKQVKAGPDEIELPGGNDANMTKLRTEYFALAKDLKERKTALGMKPGIESEEILDKAQTGLYDQENLGIDSGAYASLYRAQMLGSEKDKTEIDEATQKSKTRVTAGGVAVGVGVVGGIVGDALINGKKTQQSVQTETEEEKKQNNNNKEKIQLKSKSYSDPEITNVMYLKDVDLSEEISLNYDSEHIRWKPINGEDGTSMSKSGFEPDTSTDLKPGEWAVTFSYGTVKGTSMCSGKKGDRHTVVTGTDDFTGAPLKEEKWGPRASDWKTTESVLTSATGDKNNCWCQVTEFLPSQENTIGRLSNTDWVYYRTFNPKTNRFWSTEKENCTNQCAQVCAGGVAMRTENFHRALYAGE